MDNVVIKEEPHEPFSCGEVIVAAQNDGDKTLEENTSFSIPNDDGMGDDRGGAATAEGNPPEPNSCEDVTVAAQIQAETLRDSIIPVLNNDNDRKGADDSDEEDPEEIMNDKGEEDLEEIVYGDDRGEDDPEEVMNPIDHNKDNNEPVDHPPMVIDSDKKEGKNVELFVSKLDKKTMEDDLIDVFKNFGEIKSVRVVRHKTTNKSKGYAFIQFATNEQAETAISTSEGGIEVKGKHVNVSVSNDKGKTLYLGNICKLWTKVQVLETLKSFGIENLENFRLPDAQKEGKTRGFAFLEFDTHSDAMSAFERLRKPDAIFGRDESAKVSFSETASHPNEEAMSEAKTIYVEGLTNETEVKVKEFCERYGAVEEVRLFPRTLGKKNKDYGFICFAARENALACLEGFQDADIGGLLKVKASIAKSHLKGRPKVEKEREVPTTEEESGREKRDASLNIYGPANSNCTKPKGKKVAKEIRTTQVETGGSRKSNKKQTVSKNHRAQASSNSNKGKGKRTNLGMKTESHGISNSEHGRKRKTSDKAGGKNQRTQSTSFGKQKRNVHAAKGSNSNVDFNAYRSQYKTGYGVPVVRYGSQSYDNVSGSKRPYADMEPHAGYLEPVARKEGRGHSGHFEPPVAMHYPSHAETLYYPRGGHLGSEFGTYPHTRAIYQKPPVQTRYVDPALSRYAQPHAGYCQTSVGNSTHDTHGVTMSRRGRQDYHSIIPSSHLTASSYPPSYPQHYTSHVGYEDGSSVGDHYRFSGAHHSQKRTYY